MALEGNGSINFALDGQSDCSKIPATSSFGYQAFCWPSGIGMGSFSSNANMNLNSSTTELAAPELHPLGSINTSYCLDDLFAFPVHNNIDGGTHGTVGLLGDPLQVVGNVKVESQHLVPNAMGIKNAGHRFDQSRSSAEEPTSSQSTGESQSLKKRKSPSTDNRLLKPVASPGEKEDDCKVKQKKTSELPLNKGDSKPETKPGANGAKTEANSKQTQEKNKASEPPKDYIHVRARRGQATDSHSLAERVRREKISERMKLLQDLVPGCNKITGKAMMLDEIINYVQSLQRQVEFLSMKLEAVNPRMELNAGQILPKDILEPSTIGYATDPIMAHPQFSQPEWSAAPVGSSYGMGQQFMANAGEVSVKKTMNDKFSLMNSFGDAKNPNTWDDEIQNAVRAGVGANLTPSFATRNFHGLFPTTHSNIQP